MRKSAQTVIRPDAYYTIAAANGRVLEAVSYTHLDVYKRQIPGIWCSRCQYGSP